MNEMDLKDIQKVTLSILKQFDEICSKLDINYYLMFGTLLGAIRHKGFIPWDDDLDVAVFADDYLLLQQYFEKQHDYPLELHEQETNKNCFYNIGRICEKRHRLVFDKKKYTSGVFIDVYVLEGLGRKEDLPYWNNRYKKYNKYRKGVYCCVNQSLLYGSGIVHQILNIPFVVISKIRGKHYYIDKLNDYKSFSVSDSDYVGIPRWEECIYPKVCFTELLRVPFEDTFTSIPAGYEEILRIEFGDYMKLPAEKDRKPQHGYKAYKLEEVASE